MADGMKLQEGKGGREKTYELVLPVGYGDVRRGILHAPEECLARGDEVAQSARGDEEEADDTEDVEPGTVLVFVVESRFGAEGRDLALSDLFFLVCVDFHHPGLRLGSVVLGLAPTDS